MDHFKIVFLATDNIFAREIIKQCIAHGRMIDATIVENTRREWNRSYLANDFYTPPELDELIKMSNTKVFCTENHNNCGEILFQLKPDLVFVGGARILKKHIIDVPPVGILNAHPGLLPEYRGQDIVGWAIYNGDPVGATCHFVDAGIDTGHILIRKEFVYTKGRNLLQIRVDIMRLCAELLLNGVSGLEKGILRATPQDLKEGKTYLEMPENILKIVEKKLLIYQILIQMLDCCLIIFHVKAENYKLQNMITIG